MTKVKKLMGVQQCLLSPNPASHAIVEYICSEFNKLHNCAVYYARQIWLKSRRFVTGFDWVNELGKNQPFSDLPFEAAVQTSLSVGESISSFSALLKKANKGEFNHNHNLPNYRKQGYQLVTVPKPCLKLVNNQIRLPLGLEVKAGLGIKELFIPMPSNLEFDKIPDVRILPRNKSFYAELVNPISTIQLPLYPSKCLGLSHGIDNNQTGLSNMRTNFIIEGKPLKYVNQWYNKRVAFLMEEKAKSYRSKQLARLSEKRHRQKCDAVTKTAKIVINPFCVNGIGTLVFGWDQVQNKNANMGKKTNQKLVQIPKARLKKHIKQLCEFSGRRFKKTEEASSSQSSFLYADLIPVYAEKTERWKASGKRIKPWLYQSANGKKVNANCSGAANILRKVAVKLGLDQSGISSGDFITPLKIRL